MTLSPQDSTEKHEFSSSSYAIPAPKESQARVPTQQAGKMFSPPKEVVSEASLAEGFS